MNGTFFFNDAALGTVLGSLRMFLDHANALDDDMPFLREHLKDAAALSFVVSRAGFY